MPNTLSDFDEYMNSVVSGVLDEEASITEVPYEKSLDFDVAQLNATMERINQIMSSRGGYIGLGQQDTTDLKQELVRVQFILGQAFPKLKQIRKEIFKLQGSALQDQSYYLPL